MNFQFFVEKLKNSEEFKKFEEETKDAFPASGFFVLDFENIKNPDNKHHFDFFVPSENKMWSFQLEDNAKKVPVEIVDKLTTQNAISLSHEFDFDDISDLIISEMKEKKITNKIQRILLSLQNKDDKDFLIGTVFLSQLGLLKINIDIENMKITDFEKKSFMDMIKITRKGGGEL